MKELSIEEKAKAYDEAVLNGSRLWESDIITRESYEYMFPEIKESEDERIKKEIIRIVKIWTNSIPASNGIPVETLIAWLEKQGEQKPDCNEENKITRNRIIGYLKQDIEEHPERQERLNEMIDYLEKLCEQKPIIDGILTATNYDKMFQNCKVYKFNIDDYIKHNKANIICKIISVNDGSYYVENIKTGGKIELFNVEQNFHLWTIEDAKPGDVLACENDIVIFKENNYNPKDKSGCMFVYCSCNNFYEIGGINPTYYKPATKEQCDLLFTKMKEAGYEWDSNKKELKKIEQNTNQFTPEQASVLDKHIDKFLKKKSANIDYIDGIRKELLSIEDNAIDIEGLTNSQYVAIRAAYELLGEYLTKNQRPAWSEEDENHLDRILKELQSQLKRPFKKPYLDKIESDYNWLKLLKERYTLKPSKEQIEALEHFVRSIGESGYTSPYDNPNNNIKLLYSLLYDLKKLKGE